mmetsp:Transcript_38761/g.90118  ORF Transcript_38761/g.90118 Transcript_38761/m.90118 type:complete len:175 (-) Transcript_38761:1966-2490(-)
MTVRHCRICVSTTTSWRQTDRQILDTSTRVSLECVSPDRAPVARRPGVPVSIADLAAGPGLLRFDFRNRFPSSRRCPRGSDRYRRNTPRMLAGTRGRKRQRGWTTGNGSRPGNRSDWEPSEIANVSATRTSLSPCPDSARCRSRRSNGGIPPDAVDLDPGPSRVRVFSAPSSLW